MTRLTQAGACEPGPSGESHMRMSDEQYFRSCVARERHLAQLLGHKQIEECYETAGTLWVGARTLPQWTRDWGACGPLLAKYRMPITFEPGSASNDGDAGTVRAGETRITLADHPNPDRALMMAIVREVIRQLEHHRPAQPEQAAPLHPHP